MAEQQCPALPSGSVDFNAFHDAITKGKGKVDLAKALSAATVSPALPADLSAAESPARNPAGTDGAGAN
jgi:hypothetical protein